ncbi:copper homeostasis protein (lipoprotein) [Flavobacterium sp. 90]|uniref:copper resistance protein NlpE n=1 Tax=unclassified Flavobacterium TaxID=196869 RepID=UPI000EB3BC0D|nr:MULTISPECIES: copper resistance protein NlpE [unclassified Flavobacterium]RKR04738.1 copper homeostasis protein (lipoprotein) [Flavobacterium sp. 81]TCK56060.1 copper homeostasis protein (lipoprotein) [Flavobacterium sp. 90]
MKKLMLTLVISSLIMSCNNKKSVNTVTTSVDSTSSIIEDTKSLIAETDSLGEAKVYEGILPCADCSGIKTELKIYSGDGTMESHKFELTSTYQGREPGNVFTQKGNFNTERGLGKDPNGTIYVLNYDKPEGEHIFYGYTEATPDKIFLLDNKRQIIQSKLNYTLTLKN